MLRRDAVDLGNSAPATPTTEPRMIMSSLTRQYIGNYSLPTAIESMPVRSNDTRRYTSLSSTSVVGSLVGLNAENHTIRLLGDQVERAIEQAPVAVGGIAA